MLSFNTLNPIDNCTVNGTLAHNKIKDKYKDLVKNINTIPERKNRRPIYSPFDEYLKHEFLL